MRNMVQSIACTFLFGALSCCGQQLPSYQYKLTVVVDTPAGPRTGSAVREVTAYSEPHFLPETGGISVNASGEAVVVDLPHGKMLVALLASDQMGASPAEIGDKLKKAVPGHPTYESLAEALRKGSYRIVLAREDYPTLVTFTDPADPATVEVVTPENAATLLGPGTRIRQIDVASTREPVTHLIASRLDWLSVWSRDQSVSLRRNIPDLPTRPAEHELKKSDLILE
jgi:hypothetical protein